MPMRSVETIHLRLRFRLRGNYQTAGTCAGVAAIKGKDSCQQKTSPLRRRLWGATHLHRVRTHPAQRRRRLSELDGGNSTVSTKSEAKQEWYCIRRTVEANWVESEEKRIRIRNEESSNKTLDVGKENKECK